MEIHLKHYTPLSICTEAIRTCWDSGEKGGDYKKPTDKVIDADKNLASRIINKFKHASTAEHLTYNFHIDGVSRALLQELARHRMASPSVKSTRYTLKELKEDLCGKEVGKWAEKYIVMTGNEEVDDASIDALCRLQKILRANVSNDIAKYCLPEAYKTSLAWSINARSLQNFLALRSSKAALWEIRNLAQAVFDALPEDHKYLFEDSMAKNDADEER